jgi:hypothetical protein
VGQLRLIFQPIYEEIELMDRPAPFLVYAQRFDPITACAKGPDPASGLYRLRRKLVETGRSKGDRYGAVVPLEHIRMHADLCPYLENEPDSRLTRTNTLEICREFQLNKYIDKDSWFIFQRGEVLQAERESAARAAAAC